MRVVLEQLQLHNFKGIRSFTAQFGAKTDVYGANGSGKTTLPDAFQWLLFNKDSANRSDFAIKTLDANGEPLHRLDHEVEGILNVDGQRITLKKVYREKWTKQRGRAVEEHSGHETEHYIDGVPVKQAEYKLRVASILEEGAFKLLTSPTYFNEVLSWQERRKILLEVCGDIADFEVIGADKKLAELPKILGNHTLEEHRKIIAAEKTRINKAIETIPVRIDEAERSKPSVEDVNEAAIDLRVTSLQGAVSEKESQLARIQSGGEVADLEKQLRTLESDMLRLKNDGMEARYAALNQQRAKISDIEGKIADVTSELGRLHVTVNANQKALESAQAENERLKAEYATDKAEQPEIHVKDACPVCKQSLPESEVQAAHDKALEEFNRAKSERLESIINRGKATKAEIDRLTSYIADAGPQEKSLQAVLKIQREDLLLEKQELVRLQQAVDEAPVNPAYSAKQTEHQQISAKLAEVRANASNAIGHVQAELSTLRSELGTLQQQKAQFAHAKQTDQRIAQLREEEEKLAKAYEEMERQTFLTEEFLRAKVRMLEDRINSKFRYARFRLFETQVNGALNEVCETTYLGVPYGSGLNNAARINVGLDIISTLSNHYDAYLPLWLDNAESVQSLAETDSQTIRLLVPPTFEMLPREAQDTLIRASDGSYEKAKKALEKQSEKLTIQTEEETKEAIGA